MDPSPSRRGRVSLNVCQSRQAPQQPQHHLQGIEAEALILYLDSYGIVAASGSACASTSDEASHVLLACGVKGQDVRSSVRFTLGKMTTKPDIDYVMKYLPKIVEELRRVRG